MRVTEAIKLAGLMDHYDGPQAEYGMLKGTYAHEAIALETRGVLDEATVAPEISGYVKAANRFRAEIGVEVLEVEKRVEHPLYHGTLDLMGRISGLEAIFDYKSGQYEDWHPIQLAAYAECFPRSMLRYAVYIGDDGTYKLVEFRDRNDFKIWRAALTVALWKKEKGIPV